MVSIEDWRRSPPDAARARRIVEATGSEDIVIGDANCGWRLNEAIIAARAMEDLPRFYFEQPCPTMEECIEVRRHTSLPMVYDEVVSDVATLLRADPQGSPSVRTCRHSGKVPLPELRTAATEGTTATVIGSPRQHG